MDCLREALKEITGEWHGADTLLVATPRHHHLFWARWREGKWVKGPDRTIT